MLKIVADNKIPFLKGVLEPFAKVEYLPGAEITNEVLIDADALITRTRTKCNSASLAGTRVKLITSATIGFDHIDTAWCDKHAIKWTNAPGCNSESVKQYIAAVLALLVRDKKWNLAGKSIAVVGVGNVGRKVSAMAKVLGMKVYEVDPPRARLEKDKTFYALEEVIGKVDVVTFHTPLTRDSKDATYHLCNAELLLCMKPDAVVINSSRGEVVDGSALKVALKEGRIGDAVLDVWENEPHIDHELLETVWIATPHIAGYSQDGKAKGTQMSVQAISRFFNLGIDNWEPHNIPQPAVPNVTIDCTGKADEAVIAEAILHTYALLKDDADLRTNLAQFEVLRGAYPVRREFQAYQVELINGRPHVKEKLLALGFKEVVG
ncbi:4-phosphoerythronate dehydrogenase [Carboxylicivirga taeanensis]|uniref:4-phosphoerythronate dehydrogenase n=1 Tax=Carboxylicivirga taeanensis TaxID=1416875 RepID=UPI003F6E065E